MFPRQKERQKSIGELLELVDLTKWRDAATKTLSGQCGGAWRSLADWCIIPEFSFWMSRPPVSIQSLGSQ